MDKNKSLRTKAILIAVAVSSFAAEGLFANGVLKAFERAEKYAWRQNWDKARPLYESAASEFQAKGDIRNAALARIGLIHSRIYTTSSKQLLEQLDYEFKNPIVNQDLNLRLRCLAAKAYLEEQTDLLASRAAWNQVLEIARETGKKNWETRARGHLGILLWVIDIDSAGATREVGEALVDAMGSNDLSAQAWFLKDVGNVLCLMKRYEAAMNFFGKALVSAHMDKDCPFPLDVYIGKARGLIQMGKTGEAQRLTDQAIEEAKRIGNLNAVAEALILQARIVSTRKSSQAVFLLNTAIDLSTENHFLRTLSDAKEEMAALYVALGDDERAGQYQSECIEAARSRHDGYSLPERFSRLAQLYIKRGRISDANRLYDQITDITEGLLINSPSPYAKASLIDWLSDIFTNHFKLVLNHLKEPSHAFTILERARGRTVAEAIRSKLIEPEREESGPPVFDNQELTGLSSKLIEARTTSERKKLLDELFMAEQRMAPIIAQRNEYFGRVVPKPVSLESLQAILQKDEMVLEFVLSDPRSYCLQITQDGIVARELASRTELDTLIDQYLFEVRQKKDASQTASKLYSLLLGGIENVMQCERLTIIPDQNLNLLPFESLKNGEGKLLLESHTVGYVQSATVLHLLRTLSQEKQSQTHMLLAMGDVLYKGKATDWIHRGPFSLEGADLAPLPGTKIEVLSIAALFPEKSVVLTGKAATEESLKSYRPLSRFKLLHFAVHGYANEKFPERSALVLTRGKNSTEDGLLQDREIIELRLSADLVTLSACDSGFGKLHGQEGVSNLVKSFMFAGARTVVASLWNVDDLIAGKLMTEFYSNLVKGEDKASALRNAKLAIIQERGQLSPYFWAGFTLWGDSMSRVNPVH